MSQANPALPDAPQAAPPALPSPVAVLRAVLDRRRTIRLLARSQLASGQRDKLLGPLWGLLDPLLTLAVYFLVFGIGFRQAQGGAGEFVLHLFLGIVLWRFVSESIGQAAGCLRGQRGLILAADFPKAVIPIALCIARLYDLAWGLAVVVAVAALLGTALTPQIVWLVPVVGLLFAGTLGACFLIARLGLFFADTANIAAALLRLGAMVSPIFYFARSEHGRTGIVPPGLLDYYMLNPMAGLLGAARSALLWGEPPRGDDFVYVALVALACLTLGFTVFARGEGRYAKYV